MTGRILPYRGILPKIAGDSFIAGTAVVIGDVEIGSRSSLWYGVVVRGDVNKIRIGADTNIQDGSVVHVDSRKYGTFIGDRITIGHMALIHACTLEDDCFIGMKACVMDGAVVESGAMVAAAALVTPGKRVRAGELWSGVPAKPLRRIGETEIAGFAQSAEHYAVLAAEYRLAGDS